MKHISRSGRRAWFSFLLFGLVVIITACSGGSGSTAAPVSSTSTAVSSPTTSTPLPPSPVSTVAHPSPTAGRPTPVPTQAAPTPTPTPRIPTPTPTHIVPTPTPKPTPSPSPLPTVVVSITTDSSGSFTFSPTSLKISPGTTVIWRNMTQVAHTVTSNNGTFDSGIVSPGGSFSFKFTQAGTFNYHCQIHPFMTASVTVS